MLLKIFNVSNITLFVALSLSVIAAWYSILGLIAIFAAAVIPIIIMGSALEIAKVVTTVWLHKYWQNVKFTMRLYLVLSVISLALLTSMGIFGFLSKAHTDQNLVSGDILAKISIYDEKIKIAKDNIDANRAALRQLDAGVDQTLARSTSEQGAERSVQIRRQQGPERQRLLREIEVEQKKIAQLNEERAPIAAEVRKVEAEVGPIKYIAALIYGDDPDANLLERAVRWVIILIVFVFDPLALTLVLAANESRKWENAREENQAPDPWIADVGEKPTKEELEPEEPLIDEPDIPEETVEQVYLKKKWIDKVPGIEKMKPVIYTPEPKVIEEISCTSCGKVLEKVYNIGLFCTNKNCSLGRLQEYKEPEIEENVDIPTESKIIKKEIVTTNVTKEKPFKEVDGGYVVYDNKAMQKDAFKDLHPEFFKLTADSLHPISTKFGSEFPKFANKGDVYVRVDVLPNRVFKFDGVKWIELVKSNTNSYLYDKEYLEYLVKKIDSGEYDVDLLSENEKSAIEEYLRNQKT